MTINQLKNLVKEFETTLDNDIEIRTINQLDIDSLHISIAEPSIDNNNNSTSLFYKLTYEEKK